MRSVSVDFSRSLRRWDGFGFNYVETAQTRDYNLDPQDYGGLSLLGDADRARLAAAVHGPDGLCPGLIKLFLDPFHQPEPPAGYDFSSLKVSPAAYDHTLTTKSMLFLAREGARHAAARGEKLKAIITLYGPPAWMTRQRFVRGRDLAEGMLPEVAKYLAAFSLFVERELGIEVTAVSPHNEGEDWTRWPLDGQGAGEESHDYNCHWPTSLLCEWFPIARKVLDANGLSHTRVACGETSNWCRFAHWGYADAFASDPRALEALGLITSHGFWSSYMGSYNADHRSAGVDRMREVKPALHAWNTSSGWGREFTGLTWEAGQSIYSAKLNAIIPWAGVQRSDLWKGGDPNPQTAIRVQGTGQWSIEPPYHEYKHLCRTGRAGMNIAPAFVNDSTLTAIAFATGDSPHPNSLIIANHNDPAKLPSTAFSIDGKGTRSGRFQAFLTTPSQRWQPLPTIANTSTIDLPGRSILSLFELP